MLDLSKIVIKNQEIDDGVIVTTSYLTIYEQSSCAREYRSYLGEINKRDARRIWNIVYGDLLIPLLKLRHEVMIESSCRSSPEIESLFSQLLDKLKLLP